MLRYMGERQKGSMFYWLCAWLLACCGTTLGSPTKTPEITSLHITSDVKFRFATTTIVSLMKNPDVNSREAFFDVTLPNEAFITNMTLEIDGKVIVGEIKEKQKAKAQYEAAKQQGQTAGYIGTRHRETNRFNLNVNVAGQEKVVFHLTYQELLKRKHSRYEQVIYIDPGEPVEDMSVAVFILENRPITMLNVPRLRNDIETEEGADVSEITSISYMSDNQASVLFHPSVEFQQKQSDSGMSGQFVVQYDVERRNDAGEMLLVNGYFVHFFAPSGLERLPNDVMFILDESGSMSGKKINQLKEAMLSILKQLVEGDRFNIITFDGDMTYWRQEMMEVSGEDSMEQAERFIQSIRANGWTNIEGAIREGLKFLSSETKSDDVRSSIIVFLTDGEATSGVTDNDAILQSIKKHNEGNIPIFSLAFGKNADFEIVKKVALENNGFGRKIYEASDAAMQISGFYNEIAITLMNNVTFKYLDAPVSTLTKHSFSNYFDGSEVVVCGFADPAYADGGVLRVEISGLTNDGETIILPTNDTILHQLPAGNKTASREFETITEKVWAYLTIKQLLDEKLVAKSEEKKKELEQQALQLSLKYGFVTPLTSMVVTTDDDKTRTIDQEDEFEKKTQPKLVSGVLNSMQSGGAPMRSSHQLQVAAALLPPRPSHPQYYAYYDPGNSFLMAQSTSGAPASPSSTTTVPPQPTRRPKKNKKRNKNKTNGSKAVRHPLVVTVTEPTNQSLCFGLKKDITAGRYLAYKSQEGVEVAVELTETTKSKKGKKGKSIFHLAEVEFQCVVCPPDTSTLKITNDLLNNGIDLSWNGQSLPWTTQQPTSDSLVIKTSNLRMTIYAISGGLGVEVEKEAGELVDKEGFLGSLLNKKVKIGKIKQRKKTTRSSIKLDKSKYSFYLSKYGQSQLECWEPRKNEDRILDLDTFKLV